MEFDPDKCKMLHFGTLKQGKANMVNYSALGSVVEWSNMGVQGHSSLEVKAAFGAFPFIQQGTEYRSWEVMLQLH